MTRRREPFIEEIHPAPTPADVFRALADEPGLFFLDSALTGERQGRYSYLGYRPRALFTATGNTVTIEGAGDPCRLRGNPFDALGRWLDNFRLTATAETPVPFTGGAVGYIGYDAGRQLERLPQLSADDLGMPDIRLGIYDPIFAWDHITHRGWIIATGFPETVETPRPALAGKRVAEFKARMSRKPGTEERPTPPVPVITSNFTREEYMAAVERARQHIAAGDIFEVNLSQRFTAETSLPSSVIYERLRADNPAPFAAYLDYADFKVLSSSPELFLRLRGDRVETRPIKGTRPRGGDADDDRRLAAELSASAKDIAENVMIVDLERNDLGRVCRYGSVEVTELAALETFPSVFHLTSTVTGRLREGLGGVDLLKASFPGGSITGAPKVRAMEIIEELEPHRRGVYTGAIGWLGFDGNMDLNVAIRTIVAKAGHVYFQAGGAVTWDSDPESEYLETRHKARALFRALGANDD